MTQTGRDYVEMLLQEPEVETARLNNRRTFHKGRCTSCLRSVHITKSRRSFLSDNNNYRYDILHKYS